MTPLDIRIDHGLEDDHLLERIRTLNRARCGNGGLGLSPAEFATLNLIWERLDYITAPTITDAFRHRSRP